MRLSDKTPPCFLWSSDILCRNHGGLRPTRDPDGSVFLHPLCWNLGPKPRSYHLGRSNGTVQKTLQTLTPRSMKTESKWRLLGHFGTLLYEYTKMFHVRQIIRGVDKWIPTKSVGTGLTSTLSPVHRLPPGAWCTDSCLLNTLVSSDTEGWNCLYRRIVEPYSQI